MSENGYNPIYYNCERQGCFNKRMRPKIEQFCDCFPGSINFGDVDGVVEMNGYTLTLEWKSTANDIPTGQRIMHQRTTFYGNNSVLCVAGNAETMDVQQIAYFYLGAWYEWTDASLDQLKDIIASWATWASAQPKFMSIDAIIQILLSRHSRDYLVRAIDHFDARKQAAA